MYRTHRRLALLSALYVVTTACNGIPTTTKLQVERMDRARESFGTYFTDMVDNALLRDMALSDIHFVPHTNELNGIGAARLDRLAKLLNTYGGTVRYETQLAEGALVEQRIEHVREFLALVGCDMERVKVAVMMSGGRGMPGDEAIRALSATRNNDASDNSAPDAVGLSSLTNPPR